MAVPLDTARLRALLLDIEGTTTPVEFVSQVLFPYARAHVKEFLERHRGAADLRADIARLRTEHAVDAGCQADLPAWRADSVEAEVEAAVAYVRWLMDRDRKSTGLKALQGRIWEAGYRAGELRGQVFADVPAALGRWRGQKKEIGIFSSGSVLAQRLLFATTPAGDLTGFIGAYFDTTTGPKTEAESYRRIAATLGLVPSSILFLSDVAHELDAARVAGMQTALCVRSGDPGAAGPSHPVIRSFNEVCL